MSEIAEIRSQDPILRMFMIFMQTAKAVYKYSDMCFHKNGDVTTTIFIALKGLVLKGGTATHTELAK